MNMSSLFPNKKKGVKTKDKGVENAKPKKKGKEETPGMDIRECMAIAADKARFTQEKFLNKDPLEVLDLTEPTEEPISSQINQIQFENCVEIPEKCLVCNHKEETGLKIVPTCDKQPFPFSLDQLLNVETFVQNLTVEDINSIDISKLFISDKGFTKNEIQESILNMEQATCGTLFDFKEPLIFILKGDKNGNDVQTSKTSISLNSSNCNNNDEKKCRLNNIDFNVPKCSKKDENKEFFDVEDIFSDSDDFNLDSNTKTSTPIKQYSSAPKTSCIKDTLKRDINIDNDTSKIKSVNPFSINGSASSSLNTKAKPVFKIPQLKLNLHAQKSPSAAKQGLGSNSAQISSPESPILSGQITTSSPSLKLERKSLFPDNDEQSSFCHNKKISSPESPILSGQITTSSSTSKFQRRALFTDSHSRLESNTSNLNRGSPVLSRQMTTSTAPKPEWKALFPDAYSCFNKTSKLASPGSPILSGQVANTSPIKRPGCRVLFSKNSSDKEDKGNHSICKPLDTCTNEPNVPCNEVSQNMVTCSQLFDSEPPAENIKDISVSQLFDDSPNEENEHNITVSQLFDDEAEEDKMNESSMYTISQMMAKVAETQNKNEKISYENMKKESPVNQVKNNSLRFGSSDDEDSIFANIDLDQLSSIKQGETLKTNNTLVQDYSTNLSVINECDKNVNTVNNPTKTLCKVNKSVHFPNSLLVPNNIPDAHDKLSGDSSSSLESAFHKNMLCNKSLLPAQQRKPDSKWLSSSKFKKKSIETKLTVGRLPVHSLNIEDESDTNSDASLFISPTEQKTKNKSDKTESRLAPKKRKEKGFVEFEADVSGAPQSSDEENTSGLDDLDASFINDQTEMPLTPSRSTSRERSVVDMQSHYLQSVKSPFQRAGGYKIPTMSDAVLAMDVFSQAVQPEQDSYLNDSFCCDATEIPIDNDPSILEVAEKILTKKRKVRKRKRKLYRGSSNSSLDGEQMCSNKDKKRRRLSSGSSSGSDSKSKFVHNVKSVKRRNQIIDSSPENLLPNAVPTSSRKDQRPNLLTSEDSDSDVTP